MTVPSVGGGTGQGEISVVTNGSAVTDTTGWTGASRVTSNSPLNPLTPTAFSIANVAGAESSTSGGYASFTLPSGLQNRKLKVEFYYTSPATDNYSVSVYKGSTRVPLSTDASSVTNLPKATTGKFTAYFDTDNSASWTLNITRTSGTTGPLYITNVVCGPGIQPQGAVVGEWVSYTPSISAGFGTATSVNFKYRRVGDSVEIEGSFTAGTVATSAGFFRLPGTFTLDTTKIPNISAATNLQGNWFSSGATSAAMMSNNRGGAITATSSDTASLYFAVRSSTAALLLDNVSGQICASGDTLFVRAMAPIAEWAGSGTAQLAQNDVEYAFNSSTSTSAGDTTSFGYGPGGAKIQAITATLSRRVRFQTPIQVTDKLVIEISTDTAGLNWMPLEFGGLTDNSTWRISAFQRQAAAAYGIGNIQRVNDTDISVTFAGAACESAGGGVTFGGAGEAWGTNAGNRYWRVRKSSAGAAVGFGLYQPGVSAGLVSSSGLAGRADGNVVPSGFVGEVVTYQTVTATLASSTGTRGLASFSIPSAGIWKIEVTAWINASGDPGGSALTLSTTSATSAAFSQLLNGATASEYTDKSCYLIGGVTSRVGQNISCVAGFSGATPVYINFYSNNAISATSGNVKITALATRIA